MLKTISGKTLALRLGMGLLMGCVVTAPAAAEKRLRDGDRFDLQAFHDFVWANGDVPFVLQRWELLGERDEVDVLDAWLAA